MLNTLWKFFVEGLLIRDATGEPVTCAEAIIETGIQDDASPHHVYALGPPARSDRSPISARPGIRSCSGRTS